jgi:hypothetical protein
VCAEDPRPKRILRASLAFFGFFVLALGQVYYNSAYYDFQTQGRYMFPMLIVGAVYLAYLYRINKKFSLLAVLLAASTLYLFVNGTELFIKVYLNA